MVMIPIALYQGKESELGELLKHGLCKDSDNLLS